MSPFARLAFRRAVPAVFLLGAAIPVSANAATVKVVKGVVQYQAAAGETNQITITTGEYSDRPEGLYLDDAKPGQAKASSPCKAISTGVFCAVYYQTDVVAHLGDKNDALTDTREFEGGSSTVYGEAGNDKFTGPTNEFLSASDTVFYGGDGDDTAWDGGKNYGEAGNDTFSAIASYDNGGAGNDTFSTSIGTVDGGAGNDKVAVYGDSSGDYADASVSVKLGDGDDTVTLEEGIFNSSRSTSYGTYASINGGETTINGGAGKDTVHLPATTRALTFDLSSGTTGLEAVDARTTTGRRYLIGSGAAESFWGSNGADVIDPRGGVDYVSAGGAADRLLLKDGAADVATCGAGADIVTADSIDKRDSTCE